MSIRRKIRLLEKKTNVHDKKEKIEIVYWLIKSANECVKMEGNPFSPIEPWRPELKENRGKKPDDP